VGWEIPEGKIYRNILHQTLNLSGTKSDPAFPGLLPTVDPFWVFVHGKNGTFESQGIYSENETYTQIAGSNSKNR